MFTVSAEGSEVEAKGRMQLATLLHSINLQAAKTGTKKGNIFNKGSIQAIPPWRTDNVDNTDNADNKDNADKLQNTDILDKKDFFYNQDFN